MLRLLQQELLLQQRVHLGHLFNSAALTTTASATGCAVAAEAAAVPLPLLLLLFLMVLLHLSQQKETL